MLNAHEIILHTLLYTALQVDLMAQDILIIPIHLHSHWCLAVVDVRDKGFVYFDPMKGENVSCLERLTYVSALKKKNMFYMHHVYSE